MDRCPFHLTLSLTHRCDLACRYCYGGRPRAESMSLSTGQAAVRLGFEAAGPGRLVEVRFFGGEPLLEFSLLAQLTDYARRLADDEERPLAFAVTTNGTHLDAERARWFAERGFSVAVSVDGLPEVHDRNRVRPDGSGSAAVVIEALRRALEFLPSLAAAMTVTPDTAGEVASGVEYLAGLGVRNFEITPDYDARWSVPALGRLQAALGDLARFYAGRFTELTVSCIDDKLARVLPGGEAIRCGFGESDLAVAPSGRVYPCERLIGEDRDRHWVMGTVEEGLDEERREWCIAQRRNAEPRCAACGEARACRNACPCANLSRTGRPDLPDWFICAYERILMEAALDVVERVAERRECRV